jgi:ketosteroid isomerase-like protein
MRLFAALLFSSVLAVGNAQTAAPATLRDTIARLDTQLFDAYNHCDIPTLSNLVSDDLEFYHDKTGLAVGKAPFLKAIQENICGKVQRTLTPGSMEVYPLAHYGAVELGTHTFTHPGHPADGVGEARFVTLWQQTDSGWRVTRVISYDHESAAK